MKNILGHDDESELITIIARLRENKFNILTFNENSICFEIVLKHRRTVPVSNTTTQKIKYVITKLNDNNCEFNNYYIKQINGINERMIPFTDGYIIWTLLEEKWRFKLLWV